eukprot:3044904-Prymnesium_polylepis.1
MVHCCGAQVDCRAQSQLLSSRGANLNRHSCHAEKSISISRRDAPWHSLAVDRARHSAVRREQCALPDCRCVARRLT